MVQRADLPANGQPPGTMFADLEEQDINPVLTMCSYHRIALRSDFRVQFTAPLAFDPS